MNLNYLDHYTQSENSFNFALSKEIPFFDGHFPDQAILPAVVYIEICLLLLGEKNIHVHQYQVTKSKFLKPLAPNSNVCVKLLTNKSPYKFEWFYEDEVVAKVNLKV